MLIARSAPECRLYMDLHPCSCGETAVDVSRSLRTGPDGMLLAEYEGPCQRCGLPRKFVFTLDPTVPPPPPAYGGHRPSQIICPGQFAMVADLMARSAVLEPDVLDDRARARSRQTLAQALAAQEEVAKFIPTGADAVPADAFTSPEGAALYASERGRFDRFRLSAVEAAYREALAAHDRAR
jgi:hypothetical protein